MTARLRGLALALALAATPALAAPVAVLKLDAATQARLGVVTAPLAAAHRAAAITGFARAVDPSPLAQLDADIAAAAAALSASQAEATRTRALAAADQTVSRHVAETAAAQARADAIKLRMLRQRLGLEWGPSLQAMPDARRSRLVADLASGRATLVRVDSAAGAIQPQGAVTIDLGPGGSARAAVLGPARVSDPRLLTAGVLAVITGPQAMRLGIGATAPATLAAGAAQDGVVIPREALMRHGGQTWAFIRRDGASFERRPVIGGVSDPAGLFVASGFRPGEPVVVKGALQLFAAETPSQAE
jgi:hypothetical protein